MDITEIKQMDAESVRSICFWEGQRVAFKTVLKVITDAIEYASKYAEIVNELREEKAE